MDFSKGLTAPVDTAPVIDAPAPAATQTDVANTDINNAGAPPEGSNPPAPEGADNTQSQTPNTPPAAPDANATNQPPVNNYSFLDEMSGGIVKDEAGFKALLTKIGEFETLSQKHNELSAEMAKAAVFADDEVRIYNELKLVGASKDQLRSFQKMNEYGNLGEMSDRDARVARMIMIDGVKPSVAEKKVDLEFKIGAEDIDESEREILDDDLRVAAKKDRADLEKFKAQVSSATQVAPEEAQLQQQAKLIAHQAQVKPYVKDVVAAIPNLGEFVVAGKAGDADAVKYTIPVDAAIQAQLGQYVENYYMDGLTPVTPENTRLALNYARAEYFRENAEKELRTAYEKGFGAATEKLTNQYENRSGIKPPVDNPIVQGQSQEAATANFMTRVANRTT